MKLLQLSLLALCLFCLPILLNTQEVAGGEGIFAFAFNRNGAKATSSPIATHKFNSASKVFDALVQAKGVKNMPRPAFVMQNAEQRPAWTRPADAVVVLEEKAYDLCIQLGADSSNAIAALLAHELIHYYEKHDWRHQFERTTLNITSSDDLITSENDYTLELQADHLGGLLAHMAGYNTLGILPVLLPKIYESYHLEHVVDDSYPTLEERRSIAISSDIMLTKHSRIFDMSVYMTAAGSYEMAINYLEYLLLNTQFQSREIYNNIGLLNTLLALELMPAKDVQFRLPLELDMQSRLSTRAGNKERVQLLLNEAAYNFKNAIILDDNYAPALLNLASVFVLEDNHFDASYHAQKAFKVHKDNSNMQGMSNARVLLGIIAAEKGELQNSRNEFLAAESDLGRINLCFLRGDSDCVKVARMKPSRPVIIDDVDLNQLYARIMRDQEQALLTIDLDNSNSFHTIAKDNSEILVSLNNTNLGSYEFYQTISSEHLHFNQDIKVGVKSTQVEASLGSPQLILSGSGKSIWVYQPNGLMVFVDQNDQVIEWCLFKSNQS